jgi:hypothetical protein
VTTPRARIALLLAVGTAAALAVALALAGVGRGIALYAYVLTLVAIAVAALGRRIGAAFPATRAFERMVPVHREAEARVPQLDGLVNRISGGAPNDGDVHRKLRPLAIEIAGARLARLHGVDLELRPERARELVGPRTWELVRPDRPSPPDRFVRSWTEQDVGELVGELERI